MSVPADALVREQLARLCLLLLADVRPGMAVESGEGALERLAEVVAAKGG